MRVTASTIHPQVFDIQRFSVHDGPGIRTTVFFKGCPLHCEWCQNPESQDAAPQLMLYPDLCMACGACAKACTEHGHPAIGEDKTGQSEYGAFGPVSSPPRTGRARRCRVCGRCVEVCPTGARQIAGERWTVDELVTQAARDRPYYGSKGGVTLSGGEPLAQWPVACAVADRLRAEGVHVAIDTACLAPRAVIDEVPKHVDLVLADLKLITPERHRRWTGVGNTSILAAIRDWSDAMPGRLWVSVPVIPGVQDAGEYERMAEFCSSLAHTPPARLIPFHRLGESKYRALDWPVPDFSGTAEEQMDLASRAFDRRGIRIIEKG